MSCNFLQKILATQCFFTDHMEQKTVKQLAECPQNILTKDAHNLDNLPVGVITF